MRMSKKWLLHNRLTQCDDEEYMSRQEEALSEDRNRGVKTYLHINTSDSDESESESESEVQLDNIEKVEGDVDLSDSDEDSNDDVGDEPIVTGRLPPSSSRSPSLPLIKIGKRQPVLHRLPMTAKGRLLQQLQQTVLKTAAENAARRKRVTSEQLQTQMNMYAIQY
jgi:hypothetical protein